ncbi:MAG: hypothetical protein KJ995_03455 [Candidatus Omnitrophica bacterium]|nr:hypothetical protein [Candidatus Omnitrophota bacterium]MBU1783905.1 hypothetical protein [Candidatus Omnitrophota bacterium]MBU1851443.1 hypothetical protein [Candidatus Omnitrophota bacterium]
MIKKGIITFLFALACFIPRIAACEPVPGVSLEQNISTGNLTAPTVFSNFGTQEFKEFERYFRILRGDADEDARLIDTCVKALASGETDVFKEILFVPIKKKSIINDNRELTSTMVSV